MFPLPDSITWLSIKQQHVSEKAEAFMRLLTYPEANADVKNSTVGIASHTDFECFTIIHQNGAGLHLKNRAGDWVEAPVHEDRCDQVLSCL